MEYWSQSKCLLWKFSNLKSSEKREITMSEVLQHLRLLIFSDTMRGLFDWLHVPIGRGDGDLSQSYYQSSCDDKNDEKQFCNRGYITDISVLQIRTDSRSTRETTFIWVNDHMRGKMDHISKLTLNNYLRRVAGSKCQSSNGKVKFIFRLVSR